VHGLKTTRHKRKSFKNALYTLQQLQSVVVTISRTMTIEYIGEFSLNKNMPGYSQGSP